MPSSDYKRSFPSFQQGKGEAVALFGYSEADHAWYPFPVGINSQDVLLNRPSRLDSFGRQRVSEPYTIFYSKQIVDKGSLFFSEATGAGTSTITYNTGDASTTLYASGSGAYAIRQTNMRFNYQPGKSQQILTTFVLGEAESGTTARVGYFNTHTGAPYTGNRDGIYFGRDDGGYFWAISKTGIENKVYQEDWEIDNFTGDGPSAATLDFTKSQIGATDFEWLGVGSVRCGFVYNGEFYYAHQFNHANNIEGVYMSSPNHSIRYEVFSDGPVTALKQISASVQSEGGFNSIGVSVGVSTNGTSVDVAHNTDEILLAVRLQTGKFDTAVISEFFSTLSVTANAHFEWFLCLNPTYTGTLSWSDVPNTSLQRAIGNNFVISDRGTVLAAGFASRESKGDTLSVNTVLRLGADLDGTADIFVLGARAIGNACTMHGSLNFLELNLG